MASAAPAIERREIGGVPVFWSDSPLPFTAGLVFRAGRADETLRCAGLCHLLEHLVAPVTEVAHLEFNGVVDNVETAFFATGRRERVLAFVAETCRMFGTPAFERLETERSILTTEAASAGGAGPVGGCAALRFGPVGQGLLGYDEYGLNWIGERELGTWARTRFTRGSCAVWLSGNPGDELELELAPGDRIEPPGPRHINGLVFPSYFGHGPSGGITLSFVGERSPALSIALGVIERRARNRVRHELGLSYTVELIFVPLTRTEAHVVLVADCADAKAAAVRDALMGIVDELAEAGPTEEELAHDYEVSAAQFEEPHEVLGALAFYASGELVGEPFRSPTELLRERAQTSASDVAGATRRLLDTALLVVPEAAGDAPSRYNPYPERPAAGVHGRRHKLRGFNIARSVRAVSLVAGDEGVALEDAEGLVSRVRFDDCVALLRWPRGERALWSPDGFYVHVDPDDWRGGDDVVRLIDDRVAPELIVPMERDVADRISAVDAVASASVKRGWSNDEELDALPDHLDDGEVIVALAEARKGVRAGVLAVTDRRVLFLFIDKLVLEIRRGAIDSVDHGEGSMVQSNRLEISHGGDRVVFKDIKPKERLPELVAALASVDERAT